MKVFMKNEKRQSTHSISMKLLTAGLAVTMAAAPAQAVLAGEVSAPYEEAVATGIDVLEQETAEDAVWEKENTETEPETKVELEAETEQEPETVSVEPENAMSREEDEELVQHLNVASAAPMTGRFFTKMWGRDTADLDIQSLLYAYNLVEWDGEDGLFVANPSVVSGFTVLENEAGDRAYTLTLYDDLAYSDGTKITAWDYAFSWLLLSSKEIREIGGTPEAYPAILGYDAYQKGEVPYLEGVQVLSDDTLTVIIGHESLPFFYEWGLLSCEPYPVKTIAPGVMVADDGNGVYLTNDPDWEPEEESESDGTDAAAGNPEESTNAAIASANASANANINESVNENVNEEPRFTAELLRTTILDPEEGYLTHPSPVTGAYVLDFFDGETAELSVNEFYKGNAAGARPVLETLTVTYLDHADALDELEEENIDLINKVTYAGSIQKGMGLTTGRKAQMSNYARNGLTFVAFNPDHPEVASREVRQALAWVMDRDAIVREYNGSFGLRVDGLYGVGQWMYGMVTGTTPAPITPPEDENDAEAQRAYEEEVKAWEELSLEDLTEYQLDAQKAAEILEQAGWVLNSEGIREKDGLVLDLTLAYPEGNHIAEVLEEKWIPALEEAGIRLTLVGMPITELMDAWHHQRDPQSPAVVSGTFENQETIDLLADYGAQIEEAELTGEEDFREIQEEEIALQVAEGIAVTGETFTKVDPDLFYLGSNFDLLYSPEDIVSFAAEQEEELRKANESMRDHAAAYVDRVLSSLLERNRALAAGEETDVTDVVKNKAANGGDEVSLDDLTISERIPYLTERALDQILGFAELPEGKSIPDADWAKNTEETGLQISLMGAYVDIYQSFAQLYENDAQLYGLGKDMRHTKPGEILEYLQKWVTFQEQVNEILPVIPLYSNVYFDFYTRDLRGYSIAENVTWGDASIGAYLERYIEEEETTEEETSEEGDESDGDFDGDFEIEFED